MILIKAKKKINKYSHICYRYDYTAHEGLLNEEKIIKEIGILLKKNI